MQKEPNLFIVTGEASGDFLAARLITLLQQKNPYCVFTAVAGSTVKATGARILFDHQALNIMGFWEVVKHLRVIWQSLQKIKLFLQSNKPNLVILVDFAGFNLKVAKMAKKLGIPVLFYVSPKIWAWNAGRIHKIKKYVDHMAVLFPFEVEIYQKAEIPVTFVGHPLVDVILPARLQSNDLGHCEEDAVQRSNPIFSWIASPSARNDKKSTMALLPGSRRQEIHALMPCLIESIKMIKNIEKNTIFLLPIAPGLSEKDFAPYDLQDITLTHQAVREILKSADAAIVCSGTATLETALAEIPMVIVYKLSRISYWIARMLLKIRFIGLCNIVANECVAPELIQDAATPENISKIILSYLQDANLYEKNREKLKSVRSKLGGQNATEKVAELVERLT